MSYFTFIGWQGIVNQNVGGVKEVMVSIDNANEHIKKLYLSFGFHPTGETDKAGYCYKLEI